MSHTFSYVRVLTICFDPLLVRIGNRIFFYGHSSIIVTLTSPKDGIVLKSKHRARNTEPALLLYGTTTILNSRKSFSHLVLPAATSLHHLELPPPLNCCRRLLSDRHDVYFASVTLYFA